MSAEISPGAWKAIVSKAENTDQTAIFKPSEEINTRRWPPTSEDSMPSKTKQSNRAGFPLRMEPELKERLDRAAKEDGASLNNWILSELEEALAYRDGKIAAEKQKGDLERRLDMKFQEIGAYLAAKSKL